MLSLLQTNMAIQILMSCTDLVNLDIKYGNLTAGKLTRGNIKPLNSLNLAYGKGTIDEAGWLDLTVRYVGSFEY